jgi:hypothetical protein
MTRLAWGSYNGTHPQLALSDKCERSLRLLAGLSPRTRSSSDPACRGDASPRVKGGTVSPRSVNSRAEPGPLGHPGAVLVSSEIPANPEMKRPAEAGRSWGTTGRRDMYVCCLCEGGREN